MSRDFFPKRQYKAEWAMLFAFLKEKCANVEGSYRVSDTILLYVYPNSNDIGVLCSGCSSCKYANGQHWRFIKNEKFFEIMNLLFTPDQIEAWRLKYELEQL